MKNANVLIMMATYNGEKYLTEQINSILNQSYQNWMLIIRDDGSTDETWSILKKFQSMDERIILLQNKTQIHGAFSNFHALANYSKKNLSRFQYYMFSDQDDIWSPNKVQVLVDYINLSVDNTKGGRPALVYADMTILNESGDLVEKSINELWKIGNKNNYDVFFSHKIFGCNLLMNEPCFFSVPFLNLNHPMINKLSHDNLYAKYGASVGEIFFCPETTMGYRRHGQNITNEQPYRIELKRIINRVFNLKRLAQKHTIVYNRSLFTIKMIQKTNLKVKNQKFLSEIQNTIEKGGWSAIKFFRDKKVKWGHFVENVSHYVVFCLKLYKPFIQTYADHFVKAIIVYSPSEENNAILY